MLLSGHFGCQVAADTALRHTDRIAGLVLVGPTVDPAARGFVRQLLRWMRNSPCERASMAALNVADYRDAGVRRVAGTFTETLRDRTEGKLPTSSCLHGRPARHRIGKSPRSGRRRWTRLLPAGRLAVVANAGHMAPYRQPHALAGLVTDFLPR